MLFVKPISPSRAPWLVASRRAGWGWRPSLPAGLTARLTSFSPATWPTPAMRLRDQSDAPAVTGRVGRWHLMLLEIPSAGADPATSVRKNSIRWWVRRVGAYCHSLAWFVEKHRSCLEDFRSPLDGRYLPTGSPGTPGASFIPAANSSRTLPSRLARRLVAVCRCAILVVAEG